MRKSLLLLSLLMLSMFSQAQHYYVPFISAGHNPGGVNTDNEFPVGNGLPTGWTVILGPNQASPAWSPLQTLPFSFVFNGDSLTTFKVSSSGVLSFAAITGTAPSYTNVALPSASIPDSSICIWGIKGNGTNDNIVVKTFGTAPNRQYWLAFNSYTGENSTTYQYWSIVLEETTNKIYFVDQRFAGTASTLSIGLQYNSTSAVSITGSPNVACFAGTSETPDDNTYYEFIPGVQPLQDVWAQKLNLYPIQLFSAAPYSLSGKLLNLGSQAITAMDLNYTIDGGPVTTAALSALNIGAYATYNFNHPTSWTPSGIGSYTIKVWASAINGEADVNPGNDTVTLLVNVVEQSVQRLPLHEGFTSSTCAPCVQGNINLTARFNANPNKWSCVKYQMSWPGNGDPYFSTDGQTRRTYYGVSSVPQLYVDGGLGINTSNYTQAQFNAAYAKLSFINLTSTYTITNKTVDVQLSVLPTANIVSENLRLFAAIVEKKTILNIESNGETEFHFVEKKMLPNGQGDPINPLTAGVTTTHDLSYTFQGDYRLPNNALDPINDAIEHSVEEFSDLAVVLWIQDIKSKEVFQSCWSTLVLGTNEMAENAGIISVFPNPANNQTNLRYFLSGNAQPEVRLYNSMGQLVFSQLENAATQGLNTVSINTAELPAGIYIARLDLNGETHSARINVVH